MRGGQFFQHVLMVGCGFVMGSLQVLCDPEFLPEKYKVKRLRRLSHLVTIRTTP